MELNQPFIRLPFRFDAAQLKQESEQFEPSVWMAHPNRMTGNSAIPLVSLNGEDNNDFSGHMQPTTYLKRCAYTQQVMASFGEVLARSRLMKLSAGAEVTEHVDFNYHWYSRVRIHIPVITNPDVIFYCGDKQIHMQAGECWIFDSWRRHKVVNSSPHDRTHLVIDTAGSSRFWKLVREMEQLDQADIDTKIKDVPFDASTTPELKTERFNIAPIMAPGELEAIARELIDDFSSNPDNDPAIVEQYKYLLLDLAKDWRELWQLYGYQRDGWPRYKQLLAGTAQQLGSNPRALVTSTNDVGIKPIIMQRILRAALNVEQMSEFGLTD